LFVNSANQRPDDHLLDLIIADAPRHTWTRPIVQSIQALSDKPRTPPSTP
jgi:hypothetical protein